MVRKAKGRGFKTTPADMHRVAAMPKGERPRKRVYERLTDGYIETVFDHAEGEPRGIVWDSEVRGLQVRIGKRRVTFQFLQEHSRSRPGKKPLRTVSFERIGFWPAMNVADARKAALVIAGRIAAGHIKPGKKAAMTLDVAMAEYIEHLKAQAAKRGKPATWARLAGSLTRIHLLPVLGPWTLAELAAAPVAVRDWHRKIKSRVSANRCATLLSAAYRFAAKLDRSLPPFNPISAVRLNDEEPAQSAMPFAKFAAWSRAVESLPPIRAAFYKLVLLTGMRSGEASRLKWSDVDVRARTITIRNAKAGADIVVPMSSAIWRELKRARRSGVRLAAVDGARARDDGVIFPNVKNWNDALDFKGHTLRHTYRSVAADLGIDELQSRLLLGHSLVGINQRYVTRAVLEGGPGLRAAQAKISKRIVELLNQAQC